MVHFCRLDRVELIVFIPPVHALQLETIRAAELGGLVLKRIMESQTASVEDTGLGMRLMTGNLAAHLARLRGDREPYAVANAGEVAWVNRIAVTVRGKLSTKVAEF